MSELRVIPVERMPEVSEGAKLGHLIAERTELQGGDIVVISQKVVSKAEGMVRKLSDVEPSERAIALGKRLGKEAALVELILSESKEILRDDRVLITETHHGFVCANAGIDTSNLPAEGTVCLLPKDPDASARAIRKELGTAPGLTHQRSSSPTASAAPGGSARQRLRSDAPASTRWTTGAAAAMPTGASWRRPRSRSPTRSPPQPTWSEPRIRASQSSSSAAWSAT